MLPISLVLFLIAWLILNRVYLLSYWIDRVAELVINQPMPEEIREGISYIRHWGVPGVLCILILLSPFRAKWLSWLAPLRRLSGRVLIFMADSFSRLGEFLFHHRKPAQITVWICGASMIFAVIMAFFQHRSNDHLYDLEVALNDQMLQLTEESVLHYRNRQYFDPVKAAMATVVSWDKKAAVKMAREKHPGSCLFEVLNYIHGSKAEEWNRVSKQVGDLDEIVPAVLSSRCRPWREYHERLQYEDELYVDAVARLDLAIARVNDRRSLEGSLKKEITKAARLYLRAKSIYANEVPERVAILADNGIANYFSACFARWPSLGCDHADQGLTCSSPEDCYDKAINFYTHTESSVPESVVSRRENNTADLTMKALIYFSPPKTLPIYVQSNLTSEMGGDGSPATWLQRAIQRLENRANETQVTPEVYVTLSQLYSVNLFYQDRSDIQFKLELARKSLEYLEISHKLLALDRDYFLSEVDHRGWCGLIKELEKPSTSNQELRRRFLDLVQSFSQAEGKNWFLKACTDCRKASDAPQGVGNGE